MSQLTIRDGPVPSELSSASGDQLDQESRAINTDSFAKRILESKDKVDRRMLKLFKVKEKLQTFSSNLVEANDRPVTKKAAKFPVVKGFNPNESAQVLSRAKAHDSGFADVP